MGYENKLKLKLIQLTFQRQFLEKVIKPKRVRTEREALKNIITVIFTWRHTQPLRPHFFFNESDGCWYIQEGKRQRENRREREIHEDRERWSMGWLPSEDLRGRSEECWGVCGGEDHTRGVAVPTVSQVGCFRIASDTRVLFAARDAHAEDDHHMLTSAWACSSATCDSRRHEILRYTFYIYVMYVMLGVCISVDAVPQWSCSFHKIHLL